MGHTQIERGCDAIFITAIISGCVVMPFMLMGLSLHIGECIFLGVILGYVSGAFCGYVLMFVFCCVVHVGKRVAGILWKPPALTHEQLRHKRERLLQSNKTKRWYPFF